MEIVDIFSQFGYPALITGALIYIIATEIRELRGMFEKFQELINTNTLALSKIETTLNVFLKRSEKNDD